MTANANLVTPDLVGQLQQNICAVIGYTSRLSDRHDKQEGITRVLHAAEHFAARMEAKAEEPCPAFDSDFVHELRGAITQIQGCCEMLMEAADVPAITLSYLEAVHRTSRVMLQQVERLSGASEAGPRWLLEKPMEERPAFTGSLLVVDGCDSNRELLARQLVECGYEVDAAGSGQETVQKFQEKRYDLILLDLVMPDMSGVEVLQALRRCKPASELAVILLTARDQSAVVVQALHQGANDYIAKPIELPALLARIETQLNSRRLHALKDEFLGIASHDLKSPLTVILGGAWTLRKMFGAGEVLTAEGHELISTIHTRAELMKGIISDFLDFQEVQDGQIKLQMEAVNLNDLAREFVRCNQPYAGSKEIALWLEVDSLLPAVPADRMRLGQVLDNLVRNAIKFSAAGSTVVVRTRRERKSVVLEVCDSGPGLRDADYEKLFVKHARLSNKPSGGVGLSICKQLIELHGGDIGAGNNAQGGATFWCRLPSG